MYLAWWRRLNQSRHSEKRKRIFSIELLASYSVIIMLWPHVPYPGAFLYSHKHKGKVYWVLSTYWYNWSDIYVCESMHWLGSYILYHQFIKKVIFPCQSLFQHCKILRNTQYNTQSNTQCSTQHNTPCKTLCNTQ